MDCGCRFSTVEISIEELQRLNKKEAFLEEILWKAKNL